MPTLQLIPTHCHTPVVSIKIQSTIYYFIIDTGATHTHLNPEVIDSIRHKLIGQTKANGVGGTVSVLHLDLRFKFVTKEIPQVRIARLGVSLMSMPNLVISGLIGQDILSQFSQVVFDYKNKTVEFRP